MPYKSNADRQAAQTEDRKAKRRVADAERRKDPAVAEAIRRRAREAYAKDPEKVKARVRERRAAAPKRHADYELMRKYGLTRQEWDDLLIAQTGRCAICSTPLIGDRDPHVDHDHETGVVRGLLCSGCNLGLGHFKDDVDRLSAAIRYLHLAG